MSFPVLIHERVDVHTANNTVHHTHFVVFWYIIIKRVRKKLNLCRVSDFICIFAILKEVFCKDTNLLRKGKARACESLGFVVNKNNFFSSVSGKRRKNEKGAP